MKNLLLAATAAFALACGATAASASVSVGGFTFDDNAYVDVLDASFGTFSTSGDALATVVTDTNAATFAFSFTEGAFLDLSFTDNVVVNGAGADLFLFELGVPDPFKVTINGMTRTLGTSATGFAAGGFALNLAQFDLSDFGIASGGTISSFRLQTPPNGTIASTSLIMAYHSAKPGTPGVPEPATWAMMIMGLGAAGTMLRRRRGASVAV